MRRIVGRAAIASAGFDLSENLIMYNTVLASILKLIGEVPVVAGSFSDMAGTTCDRV